MNPSSDELTIVASLGPGCPVSVDGRWRARPAIATAVCAVAPVAANHFARLEASLPSAVRIRTKSPRLDLGRGYGHAEPALEPVTIEVALRNSTDASEAAHLVAHELSHLLIWQMVSDKDLGAGLAGEYAAERLGVGWQLESGPAFCDERSWASRVPISLDSPRLISHLLFAAHLILRHEDNFRAGDRDLVAMVAYRMCRSRAYDYGEAHARRTPLPALSLPPGLAAAVEAVLTPLAEVAWHGPTAKELLALLALKPHLQERLTTFKARLPLLLEEEGRQMAALFGCDCPELSCPTCEAVL
jgi:hypothetical protein